MPKSTAICEEPGCNEIGRKKSGLCRKHYIQRYRELLPSCNVVDCVKSQHAYGYCSMHYKRLKKTGTLDAPTLVNQGKCPVDGCTKSQRSGGLCKSHYDKAHRNNGEICTVDGCRKNQQMRTLCGFHYNKWRASTKPKCDVAECNGPAMHLLWCDKHYQRVKKYGSTELPPKRRELHPNWRGGEYVDGCGYLRVRLYPGDRWYSGDGGKRQSIPKHRLIMQEYLGRQLSSDETVHHIDGDRLNNDISNLQLRMGKHGKGIVTMCVDCGSHNIKAIPIAG